MDTFLVLTALAGLLVGGWLLWLLRNEVATFAGGDRLAWWTFWLLAACAIPAELVRVPTWYRGGQAWLTMSRAFVLALLVGWGAPLAIPVFVIASVVSDLIRRKGPGIRIAFNAAQYVLSIAAADVVYTALGGKRSFALPWFVPAFMAATVVLLIINRGLVRVGVGLLNQHPLTPGYVLAYNPLVEEPEALVQLSWVAVALLVAERRPLLVIMLAAPVPLLFAAGKAAELVETLRARLETLRTRRRGFDADELAERVEAVLQLAALERTKLAADLHDGALRRADQLIDRIHTVKTNIGARDPDAARQLRQVEEEVPALSRELRLLVAELRPPVLQRSGLADALTRLARKFQAAHGIACAVQAPPVKGLPEQLEVLLYRVTQEALTNVVKHAHASHVDVTVAVDHGAAHLQIHDDGDGFDPQLVQEDAHYGLALLRRQVVELAGGVFQVDSMPGRGRGGTTVTAEIQLGPGW